MSKNFKLAPEVFDTLPESQKYIFQGSVPGSIDQERPTGAGVKPSRFDFTLKFSEIEANQTSGGSVKIADSLNFPISKTVAAAEVVIKPGAIREMHWHPTADEWSFFMSGRARVTIFASQGNARTFDVVPGDVLIVPANMGHFVENIDDEPVEMLEIFRADQFLDVSLFQWMGETPKRMVLDTLYENDPENGEKFWDAVKGAQKDPVH
jgi:oxalate decarboxylase family bicupin protein